VPGRRGTDRAAEPTPSAAHPYTLAQLQQLIGLGRSSILGLVAAGYVTPARGARREYRFSFQDAVLLRSAHRLLQAHIPRRRLLAALRELRQRLPAELPLSGLRIQAIGGEVAVRERGTSWHTAGGQMLIDFEISAPAGPARPARDPATLRRPEPAHEAAGAVSGPAAAPTKPAAATVAATSEATADASAASAALFDAAAAAEAPDPAAAEALYRRLLRDDPAHEDAYANLGALLCDQGRFADAASLYAAAAAVPIESALLRFNHGVALDGAGDEQAALDAYRRTLALDPTFADAHYNAAAVCDRLGDARGALRHFSAYRRLTGAGSATPGRR
jgi:tetratricopeptide (TPR) repeat protein